MYACVLMCLYIHTHAYILYTEIERENSFIHWSLLKWLQKPGFCQTKIWNEEFHPYFTRRCGGPTTWTIFYCLVRSLSGSWI